MCLWCCWFNLNLPFYLTNKKERRKEENCTCSIMQSSLYFYKFRVRLGWLSDLFKLLLPWYYILDWELLTYRYILHMTRFNRGTVRFFHNPFYSSFCEQMSTSLTGLRDNRIVYSYSFQYEKNCDPAAHISFLKRNSVWVWEMFGSQRVY